MIFAIIMFFTQGPTSPFFVYFVFSLVCATLRWHWRGTLWTAIVSLAVVVLMAFYPMHLIRDPNFEMNRFIIRIVYLIVVAVMLGCLGAYEGKLREDLGRLAAWPRTITSEAAVMLRGTLEHAAGILAAPRMILAWEEEEEPWLHLAAWSEGEFDYSRESPGIFGNLVAEPLTATNFFCPDARRPEPVAFYISSANLQKWQGNPLDSRLQGRFAIGAVLSLKLRGKNFEGFIYALDKPKMTSDDLVLGEIIAHEVTNRLEQFYLFRQLQQAVVMEERIRLARDLHDGLLQSLTGMALQLETALRLLESDPKTAQQRLRKIQDLTVQEQRNLRFLIQGLKPGLLNLPEVGPNLTASLEELRKEVEQRWGLRVELDMAPLGPEIQGTMRREIYFIVHEALVNAARHSAASTIRGKLTVERTQVNITVSNNGHGFPFLGRYGHSSLIALNLGPVTLKERISNLSGSLTIESTEFGSRLEITLPLDRRGR